ncbi:hypothetical protein E6O75_ATG03838 [Venturia nashicola]|uniref:Uncharacterized protein n=1 Tax=Venturia nashicola TaxID=86259 RepID=A0A4Z1PBI3_9PEZI|nr:hypothetical protein E6O75_ATG03838 [Venturia nashicola]
MPAELENPMLKASCQEEMRPSAKRVRSGKNTRDHIGQTKLCTRQTTKIQLARKLIDITRHASLLWVSESSSRHFKVSWRPYKFNLWNLSNELPGLFTSHFGWPVLYSNNEIPPRCVFFLVNKRRRRSPGTLG